MLGCATLLLAALGPGAARAQPAEQPLPSPPVISAARTDTPPVIDGRLDDPCWADAPGSDAFTQVLPVEGAPPSERTLVRILFDADSIYIAVRCLDSNPAGIIARQMARDGDNNGDDLVRIAIDPFADRRNGYQFDLTAAGGKFDGLIDGSRTQVSPEWDGIWHGKATVDAEGWAAEVAIPFKTISFDSGAAAWGFNIEREIRRRQELVRWSSARANVPITNLAEAGVVTGLAGLRQGIGLTFKPYVSTRVDTDDGGLEIKPGLDLFYKVTPSTTAAVTVNTDFAEAEVDERVVNLTRFPIFFPEKRAFFLQDTTVFSFGGIRRSPIPFYSRRIGIVGGRQKDILAGVRVTGREGGINFGAMSVQMYDDRLLGSKNLSVARLSANLLAESNAGVILTHGDPGTTGDNTLFGADFNGRSSTLFGDQVLETHAWVLGTLSSQGPDVPGAPRGTDGEGLAFGGRVSYPNDRWSWSLFAARYGEDFNPALGFVQRPGSYEVHADLGYRWRPNGYIRSVELEADQALFWDLDGNVQTQEGALPGLTLENQDGDSLSVEHEYNRDVPTEDFEIIDGVVIPPDDYRFSRLVAGVELSPSRVLAPAVGVGLGDYYTGTRTDYEVALNWRPSNRFFGSVEYEYNDIDLPQGSFIVRVVRARASVLFSPALSWDNVVQFDNESENLGINSRVRWEVQSGQEVFVVLNQGYDVLDGHRFRSTTGDLTVKVGLTFRF